MGGRKFVSFLPPSHFFFFFVHYYVFFCVAVLSLGFSVLAEMTTFGRLFNYWHILPLRTQAPPMASVLNILVATNCPPPVWRLRFGIHFTPSCNWVSSGELNPQDWVSRLGSKSQMNHVLPLGYQWIALIVRMIHAIRGFVVEVLENRLANAISHNGIECHSQRTA